MDASTDLYCIFGSPVRHSRSPLIHNMLFRHHGRNAAYLAFEPSDIQAGVSAIRSLPIKGASVTIPFKEQVIPLLDEISEEAQRIGAVNTIVNREGVLWGYNTDCMGAITPLKPHGIKGKKVLVLGAGGAAMAVIYGIIQEGGSVLIANRSEDKALALARRFECDAVSLESLVNADHIDADVIINTTSVGMEPNADKSPLPERLLNASMIVMDAVYAPLDTRLLKQAAETGATIIDGLSMFLYQGAAQFNLWTGLDPDLNRMRQIVLQDMEKTK